MKRMYVVLAIMFLIVFWAGALLGQQGTRPADDREAAHLERVLKLRREMHRRMMDKLLLGTGPDQDLFSDMEGMMNDLMSESLAGPGALRSLGNANYKIEWLEDAAGRTLAITPDDPREQLDINVADGLITLKGRHEQKTPNGVTYSNFTNSFSVPADCDPSKVKIDQKNGRILVLFPYLTARAPKPRRDERRPLPPSSSDVAI